MSQGGPGLRATGSGRLGAALLAGLAAAWLIGGCASGGTATNAKQAVSNAAAHVTGTSTSTDPPPATTTTATETSTVREPAQTVTRTRTVQSAPPTTSIANKTTNVAVTPTSTTGEETGNQIPWWGWLLIGFGAAAVAVGIFAAGHRRGARTAAGAQGSGAQGSGGMPSGP